MHPDALIKANCLMVNDGCLRMMRIDYNRSKLGRIYAT
jgi:hypothetical protein